MKIWIHVGGVQEGPYELEALPLDRMNAATPVWYEGLTDWTPAGQASVTAGLFGTGPIGQNAQWQPQAAAAQKGDEEKCPQSYLAWSIVLTILCCNPLGIIPIITGSTVRSKFSARDYAGAKRMSETTAWLVMILIVTCLMLSPFALIAM